MYATPTDLAVELNRSRFEQREQTRAESCLEAASAEIDEWIDWPYGEADPEVWTPAQRALVKRVCLARATEWWKASDAAFGAIGFADIGVLRAPKEGFLRHGMALVPLKQQWGVA